MRKTILTSLLLAASLFCSAQINMADTSAQAITYWYKGDVVDYTVIRQTFRSDGGDTLLRSTITCDVQIKVLKQTDKEYTIEWTYLDVTCESAEVTEKLKGEVLRGQKLVYITDECGKFLRLVNWKDVQKGVLSRINGYKYVHSGNQLEIDSQIASIKALYSSQESIEESGLKDMRLYHAFYGGAYKMSEDIEATSKAHNAFGGEPLDVHVTIGLNCVWPDEECYELFFRTQVDSEQLMAEVRNHIKKVAASGNYGDVDQAMENMQAMKNSTETFSMFNSDGWLLESVSTIEVAAEGQFNREVCTIEIKE